MRAKLDFRVEAEGPGIGAEIVGVQDDVGAQAGEQLVEVDFAVDQACLDQRRNLDEAAVDRRADRVGGLLAVGGQRLDEALIGVVEERVRHLARRIGHRALGVDLDGALVLARLRDVELDPQHLPEAAEEDVLRRHSDQRHGRPRRDVELVRGAPDVELLVGGEILHLEQRHRLAALLAQPPDRRAQLVGLAPTDLEGLDPQHDRRDPLVPFDQREGREEIDEGSRVAAHEARKRRGCRGLDVVVRRARSRACCPA